MNTVAEIPQNLNTPDQILIRARLEALTRTLVRLEQNANLGRVTVEDYRAVETSAVQLFALLLQPLSPYIRREAQSALQAALFLVDCQNLAIAHTGNDRPLFGGGR